MSSGKRVSNRGSRRWEEMYRDIRKQALSLADRLYEETILWLKDPRESHTCDALEKFMAKTGEHLKVIAEQWWIENYSKTEGHLAKEAFELHYDTFQRRVVELDQRDGFECDKCGACCNHADEVEIVEADVVREPRLLDANHKLNLYLGSGTVHMPINPCRFQKEDKTCGIYETRPGKCRDFFAGSSDCQAARVHAGLPLLEKTR